MIHLIKYIFIFLAALGLFSACVNDTFDIPVKANCVSPELTKTKEVSAIYGVATNITATYPADDIIEAYVISSDEGGNFYKSMYLQAVDGTKGFNLSVDEVNTYTKNLQPGKRVFLKLTVVGLVFLSTLLFSTCTIFLSLNSLSGDSFTIPLFHNP